MQMLQAAWLVDSLFSDDEEEQKEEEEEEKGN